MKNPQLIPLMQRMADLTKPECGRCRVPWSCCHWEYCETARHYAKEEWGVDLVDTGHPTVPFLGEQGCTVAPHLRPLCTLHTCQINGVEVPGVHSSGDPDWDREYFALRDEINDLEFPHEARTTVAAVDRELDHE
jgi:hypothetical protein